MKKIKNASQSGSYKNEYYSNFCRKPEEFLSAGITSGYLLIKDLLSLCKNDAVLDIGCGRGEVLLECEKAGAFATGIDFSSAAVGIARKSGSRHVARASATHLPFKNATFNKIVLMEIIEHMDDLDCDKCISETRRVLKPGGLLVLTTPNAWNNVMYALVAVARYFGVKIAWYSRPDPYHINIHNPLKLYRVIKKHYKKVNVFPILKHSKEIPKSVVIKRLLFFPFKHIRCTAQ